MKSWTVNGPFDGAKFAARYGLNSLAGDFSMNGNVLTVRPDFKVTDDPPIFEPSDPPLPTITSLINAPMVPPLAPALKTILLRLAGGN